MRRINSLRCRLQSMCLLAALAALYCGNTWAQEGSDRKTIAPVQPGGRDMQLSGMRLRGKLEFNDRPVTAPIGEGGVNSPIPECNGVRGGAAGIPFIDLTYKETGVEFYANRDMNSAVPRWESSVMQAIWQLCYTECDTPPPGRRVSIGKKVYRGYWSETGTDQGGKEWPIEKDPQWPANPINPGCSLWIPGEPYLYVNGDFDAQLTFTRTGQVRVNVSSSTFPKSYVDNLAESLRQLSGHPAVMLPPGYSDDSIDLILKVLVKRKPGPLMSKDAKPVRQW